MAVKDEYEVARLFTDGSFQRQLDAEFEGDYRVEWHAAPPRIPVVDWFVDRKNHRTGRTQKISFGPWFFRVLRVIARMKFLRGTPLDFFGRTEHRRLEQRLIGEYQKTLEELLDGLCAENHEIAVEIAGLPASVRGFEMVKEEQLEKARAKQAELFERFRRHAPGAGTTPSAEA